MKFDPFGEDNFYTLSPEEAELSEDRVTAVRDGRRASALWRTRHLGTVSILF